MFAGEWEARQGMIEAGVSPRRGVMAVSARRRNSGLLVIRIGGAVVILHVARCAILTGEVVVPIYVALRTWQSCVRPGEGESHNRVIKACGLPSRCAVASLATFG